MSEPATESTEHAATPLELFFDLVFVFAITQVTSLLTHDPTWHGALRAALVVAAVWWSWTGYAWLTSTLDVDEGGVRIGILAAMAAMLVVALAVPKAFASDAVLFGVSFLLFRIAHLVLYAYASREETALRGALLRLAPGVLLGSSLIVVAGFLSGELRIALWIAALAIDYATPALSTMDGWRIAPAHFAERHGLIVLIALGESIIAIGVGAGLKLTAGVITGALLGVVVISALWWLYFDVAAILARRRLVEAHGVDQVRLARDGYSYLHLPILAGIVFFAFGLKTTLHDVHASLDNLAASALCGGVALYLLGHVTFLFCATGRIFRRRTIGVLLLLGLVPVAAVVTSLAALALVGAVCVFVVVYEVLRHRTHRVQVRHPAG